MAEVKALHAEVRQADGLTFIARGASNHWVTIDTSEAEGGHAAGSGPMELLLMALGACTSMHVAGTLAKMKQPFSGYRVELSGERQEELPHRFTRIFVDYYLTSDTIPTADVDRAMRGFVGIPDNELVITMLGLGHMPEHFKVPRSQRKPLGEVLRLSPTLPG